jgi:hypothetical protein
MRSLLWSAIVLLCFATATVPAAAQPQTFPVNGLDNFFELNDAETARNAGDAVTRMRDAIARCDRPAWEAAYQRLRDTLNAVSFQLAILRRLVVGAHPAAIDLLFKALFDERALELLIQSFALPEGNDVHGLRYPDPCERRVGFAK